jgi:hypothetical protein
VRSPRRVGISPNYDRVSSLKHFRILQMPKPKYGVDGQIYTL